MSLLKKVRAVENLYNKMEKEIAVFQQKTGFSCIANCHSCCIKENIEATPIEFLPLAYHLYKTNQAYSFIEKLEQYNNQSICILFNPFNPDGACDLYKYRSLICRLFGFSAKINQKNIVNLITCKKLKEEKKQQYDLVQMLIQKEVKASLASDYYLKLYSIDMRLSMTYMNINEAMKKAIETVLFYFSFRDKKVS